MSDPTFFPSILVNGPAAAIPGMRFDRAVFDRLFRNLFHPDSAGVRLHRFYFEFLGLVIGVAMLAGLGQVYST